MRKNMIAAIAVFALVWAACGSNFDGKYAHNPVYQKGKTLVANNDCLTCHEINGSAIGPAYTKVADKYADTEANVDTLAQKILRGGSGHWGNMPMTPHAKLSLDDAKAIARYILLLKTK